jgi:hypothetical protein
MRSFPYKTESHRYTLLLLQIHVDASLRCLRPLHLICVWLTYNNILDTKFHYRSVSCLRSLCYTTVFSIQNGVQRSENSSSEFATCFTLISCLAYCSTLKTEVTCSCEMSIDFQRTTELFIYHTCSGYLSQILSLWQASELELEFFLRPTVRRQVRLGIGPPFGTLDQILACSSFFV